MNVLILGSGGREHALAWKIAQSDVLSNLYVLPGNAGTATFATNLEADLMDFQAVKQLVLRYAIDLVVVGSEQPLVAGIANFFSEDTDLQQVAIIAPSRQAAQLEGSKEFAKQFMARHGIPTAAYRSFTRATLPAAHAFLESMQPPYVLKADGLAAGKGVVISETLAAAKQALDGMFDGKFGAAGSTVVIEAFLRGIELSVFVLTDGKSYQILPEAKDYKRIGEGDTGLNTGGMGAVSPVPFADAEFMQKVETRIIKPTVLALAEEKLPYTGFIFFGLMNVGGEPFVIEYNVRMGDPETEAVMPRIESDFLDLLWATARGELASREVKIDPRTATTVVLVSKGYPEFYEKGKKIYNLEPKSSAIVFHAGTKSAKNAILTAGGRVLAVTGMGNSVSEALAQAYETAREIEFEGKYFRKDIAFDL